MRFGHAITIGLGAVVGSCVLLGTAAQTGHAAVLDITSTVPKTEAENLNYSTISSDASIKHQSVYFAVLSEEYAVSLPGLSNAFYFDVVANGPGGTYSAEIEAIGGSSSAPLQLLLVDPLTGDTTQLTEFPQTEYLGGATRLEGSNNFTLPAGDVTLRFAGHDSVIGSGAIDFYVLEVVPEPASLGLLGLGVVGLMRRKR